MKRGSFVKLTAIALVLGCSTSAFSQGRPTAGARARTFQRRTDFQGAADRGRPRLGTFQSNRYDGVRTRTEQLDELIRAFRRPSTRDNEVPPTHPVRVLLDRRNLLSPRSALAVKSVSTLGRNLVTDQAMPDYDRGPAMFPAASQPAVENPFLNELQPAGVSDIEVRRTADDYFNLGVIYFRKGDYLQARSYFDLDADLNYDLSRPFIAGLLTSYQNQDYYQAYSQLLAAIKRAKVPADLKIDPKTFFEDPREFTRALNNINIWAKSVPDSPGPSLILAYYSWLNGDQATTIGSVDAALKNSTAPNETEMCQKFRDLVTSKATTQP